jgi:serine/threonine-protein kinase
VDFGGTSKLIELPPAALANDVDDQKTSFLEASTAADLTQAFDLSEDVLDRVLYKGDTFGPYKILGFIAAGGMGEIYAAERRSEDGSRRQPVALKVVKPNAADKAATMAQLEREAQICKAIHSRHVVRIYEYGVDRSGRCFMAMELLKGEELFDRMRERKVIPLRELAELGVQIMRGLYTIHRAGVVHRDIKPENVFLTRDPITGNDLVKILDFGIARWKKDDAQNPLGSDANQIIGTPQYLAPEQSRTSKVDWRADIYSMGVILYECATGSPPFDRGNPYATMHAHQTEPVPSMPSTLDPEFCEIVYRALAKKPSERWQSADELRYALDNWLEQTSWVDELPGGDEFGMMMGGVSAEELMSGRPLPRADVAQSDPRMTPMFTSNEGIRRTHPAGTTGVAPGRSHQNTPAHPSPRPSSAETRRPGSAEARRPGSGLSSRDAMPLEVDDDAPPLELDWGAFKPESPAGAPAHTSLGEMPAASGPRTASGSPSYAPRHSPSSSAISPRPTRAPQKSSSAGTILSILAVLAIAGAVAVAILDPFGTQVDPDAAADEEEYEEGEVFIEE